MILFSLGTNIRSDKLTNHQKSALLQAFAKIPQTVIWKFETDTIDLPKNVIIRKWLPQNDILGNSYSRSCMFLNVLPYLLVDR